MAAPPAEIEVEVVYALPGAGHAVTVRLAAGATLRDAVRASGLLERHPELASARCGIFGRLAAPQARLAPGDRVEIYRPLSIDPKEARRRRAARKR
jgi:putative ubiquitin-RnfH superfamily antitoxin RatB of RatAB toxin-antitoxin module